MAAYDGLLGGGGNGTVLPSVAKADDLIKSIRSNLEAIESTMGRLSGQAHQFTSGLSGSTASSGGTASNGMPIRMGAVSTMVGGGPAHGNGMPSSFGLGTPVGQYPVSTPMMSRFAAGAITGGPGGHGYLRTVGLEMAQQGFQAMRAGVPDKMQSDLIWNRITMMTGNGQAYQRALPGNIANLYYGGFAGRADMNAGLLAALNAGVQGSTLVSPGFASGQTFASQQLGLTMQQSMQMATGIMGNQQGLFQSRVWGEKLLQPNGDPRNLLQQLNEELRSGRGSAKSLADINAGLSPWGGLNYNLRTEMGLSQEQISQVKPLFEAAMKAGTGIDPNNPQFTAALKSINGGDTALKFAMSKAGASAQLSADQYSGWRDGIDAANQAASGLAKSLDVLNDKITGGAAGYVSGSAGGFMGGLSQTMLGGAVNAGLEGLIFKQLLGKGAAPAGGLVAGLGSRLGLGGVSGLGLLARGGAAGIAGLAGVSATNGITGLEDRHTHGTLNSALHVGTDVLGYGATGAAIGSIVPVIGTAVGGAIGAAAGLGKGLFDVLGGDSKQDSDKARQKYKQWAPDVADAVKIICARFHISATTYPGHEPDEQHAADFWPSPLDQGTQIAEWAKQNAGPLNIQYVIWRQHIWNVARSSEGWRQMEDRGSRTQNHFDHVHISFKGGPVGKTSDGTSASSDSLSQVRDTGANTGGATDSSVAGFFNSAQSAASAVGMTSNSLGNAATGSTGMVGEGAIGAASSTSATAGDTLAGGKSSLAFKNLVSLAQSAGFSASQATTMAAIAMAESGGHSGDLNNNPKTGDLSYGLWQINMIGKMGPGRRKEFGISSNDALFDPRTNAHAAFDVFRDQGFGAWSTYKSGAYLKYLNGYDKGAWKLDRDEVAQVHKGEMILPKDFANAIRQVMGQHHPSSGSSPCNVQITVVTQGTTDAQARAIAQTTKKYLEHENHLSEIGSM